MKIKIFILCCFLYTIILGQTGWQNISNIYYGIHINSIFFVDEMRGFAAANNGSLYSTADGGKEWKEKIISADLSLNKIFFTEQRGYIAADSGRFFICDFNLLWREKDIATGNNLNSLWFNDNETGFVFGDSSTLFKTTDAGEEWRKIDITPNLKLTDGAFSTPDFGIAISEEGKLLRSFDSGENWQTGGVSSSFGPVNLYSISFCDESAAFIGAFDYDVGCVVKLFDYANEIQLYYPSMTPQKTVHFRSVDEGISTGWGGAIMKTTDSGITWDIYTSLIQNKLNSMYFLNDTLGYAAGNNFTILKTTDFGNSWCSDISNPTSNLINAHFFNKKKAIIIGQSGEIFSFNNENLELLANFSSLSEFFCWLHFTNDATGFIGAKNKILKTTDQGVTWLIDESFPQSGFVMSSCSFFNNNLGFIALSSAIVKTSDGGNSWQLLNRDINSRTIYFVDEHILLSGSWDGEIYRSTDQGESWLHIYSTGPGTISDFKFLSRETGFAINWSGDVYKTTDGGYSWRSTHLSDFCRLHDINFIDAGNGYIVGDDGKIFYSSDMGESWLPQSSGINQNLNSIIFLSDRLAYITGDFGAILRTTTGGFVSVKTTSDAPAQFRLYQNFPNPFNPSTKIKFNLQSDIRVRLEIFDISGRLVKNLVNDFFYAGTYEITFNGTAFSSGVYLLSLKAGSDRMTKKLILLK